MGVCGRRQPPGAAPACCALRPGSGGTLEVTAQEGGVPECPPPQLSAGASGCEALLSVTSYMVGSGQQALPASSRRSSRPDANRGQSQEGLTQNALGLPPRLSGSFSL